MLEEIPGEVRSSVEVSLFLLVEGHKGSPHEGNKKDPPDKPIIFSNNSPHNAEPHNRIGVSIN